jgi:sensor histidine kinase regulating citrate/malate metabolism
MAIANVLFVYVMHYLLQVYEIDKLWITHLPLIICCIFGLGMQYGLLAYKDEQAENAQLEYFLRQGNKQYEMTKNSIDLINMKAHDLKHYIRRVQEMHEYDHDELQEIAEVVEEYENTVNCGNKTLDVVLTDKQYQCKEYSISLSLIVQGEELSFMRDSDLCSIFSNALDNAIECERKIEKESNRCIALKVFRKGDIVCIHIENYCEQFPEMQDGLPLTSKEDKTSHGFGMKSIRYIVEKYQGSMQIGGGANLFVLNILIPVPCK